MKPETASNKGGTAKRVHPSLTVTAGGEKEGPVVAASGSPPFSGTNGIISIITPSYGTIAAHWDYLTFSGLFLGKSKFVGRQTTSIFVTSVRNSLP